MADGSPGELRRVASSRDQLDGIRPTFVALDEIATFPYSCPREISASSNQWTSQEI